MKYVSPAVLAALLPFLALGLQGCGGSSDEGIDDVPTSVVAPNGAVLRAQARTWVQTGLVVNHPGDCSARFTVTATVSADSGPFPDGVAVSAAQAWKTDRQLTEISYGQTTSSPDGRSVEATDGTCLTFDVAAGDTVTVVVEMHSPGQSSQQIKTAPVVVRNPG